MRVIEVQGSARQQGQAHGETLRKEIRELAGIRRELLAKYLQAMHPREIERLAFTQVEALRYTENLFEEFCGISEGAHIGLTDLMVLNNYTDMRDFSFEEQKADEDGGCSLFSVRTETSNFCGQTWDMHGSAIPYVICLQTPEVSTLTVAGCLGLAGVNRHGLSVCINNMHCSETSIGLMWPALVRLMLEQPSAEDAAQVLKNNLPCSGHNYLICDQEKTFNIETTGVRVQVTDEFKQGVCFHTNHYLSPLKESEIMSRQSPSTHRRLAELERYLSETGLEQMEYRQFYEDILTERFSQNICIKPSKETDNIHAGVTCGGMIIDYHERSGLMFSGMAAEGNHHTISW